MNAAMNMSELRSLRRAIALARIADEEEFRTTYPQFPLHTKSCLTGTVCSCKDSGIHVRTVTLMGAKQHHDTCGWCQHNYALAMKERASNASCA